MSLSSHSDSLASSGENETDLFSPFSNISKLWSHKFLIRNLVQREVRGKYRNAMLGYAWSVIEPTLLSVVYWFLFIMLAGNPDENYAVWVLIGVIVWGCFGNWEYPRDSPCIFPANHFSNNSYVFDNCNNVDE